MSFPNSGGFDYFLGGRPLATRAVTTGQFDYFLGGRPLAVAASSGTAGTAAITGTATASITEADIIAGGKTVIITLTGDTWVASGATFDAQRQNIINGLNSAQSEAHGWNVEVKAKLAVTTVVRTSATVVTVTLSAQSAYDITTVETITVTVPATAVVLAAQIVATPTFTVTESYQLLFPTTDVLDGSWTDAGGSNVNLFANIDEDPFNDADYIKSATDPTADLVKMGLGNPGTPGAGTWTMTIRHRKI